MPMYPIPQQVATSEHISIWIRLKDILHTLALLGGLGYVMYWIYKASAFLINFSAFSLICHDMFTHCTNGYAIL